MSRVQDKDVERTEPPREAERPPREPPGRVEVDSRGHNVWRWSRETNDSTSVVLKRLDNDDLALEPTQRVPVVPGSDPRSKGVATKGATPKGATPKGATPKGATPKAAASEAAASEAAAPKGAPTKGTSPKAAAANGKKSAAPAEPSKKSVFHPALQRDRKSGGGFDPYNSR
jgi:hypothetical protein